MSRCMNFPNFFRTLHELVACPGSESSSLVFYFILIYMPHKTVTLRCRKSKIISMVVKKSCYGHLVVTLSAFEVSLSRHYKIYKKMEKNSDLIYGP